MQMNTTVEEITLSERLHYEEYSLHSFVMYVDRFSSFQWEEFFMYVGGFSSFHGEVVLQVAVAVEQQSYQDETLCLRFIYI